MVGLNVTVTACPFSVVVTTASPAVGEDVGVNKDRGTEAPVKIVLMFGPVVRTVPD